MENALNEFRKHLTQRNKAAATIRLTTSHIKGFFRFLPSQQITSLKNVNWQVIEKYHAFIITSRILAKATIASKMQVISLFFRFLYRFGHIKNNPVELLVIPKSDRSLPKDILSKGEMERLIEAPDISTDIGIRDRALLETFYASGLRLSEIYKLNIADVDTSGKILMVDNSKNHNSRVVPITTQACYWITRYRQTIRHKYLNNPFELALFIGFRGGHRMHRITIRLVVKQYARKAGISKRIYPHLLRHSFASHLVANSASSRDVQEMLGHKSLDTTQIYVNINPAELTEMLHTFHPREQNGHY